MDTANGRETLSLAFASGMMKLKWLPSPGILSTSTRPPCASTMPRTIASP